MEKSQKQVRTEIRQLETQVKALLFEIQVSPYVERTPLYRQLSEKRALLRDLKEQVKH